MFWIICAALVAIVAWVIMAPIMGARRGTEPTAAYDLRVYRDQLKEVDRDLERDVISAEDAARLRTEIGRKVLDADRRLSEAAPSGKSGGLVLAAALLALFLGGAFALYWREGEPGNPDQPMTLRLAEAKRAYTERPSQEAAEAKAKLPPPPQMAAEDAELIQKLRDTVAQQPDDPEGQRLLVVNETRSGNLVAARKAQQHYVQLLGDQAKAGDYMHLAALMIESAGGIVTPEAEAALNSALKLDPQQPQSRYMQGIMYYQNGRPDLTFPLWRRLLEQGPPDAPWIGPIRAMIPDVAWLAGEPNYTPPAAAPGPDAEAIAAADDMTPEERQQFIESMVGQLEGRLAEQGGTPEEWARLISSLVIIGKEDHARDILKEAQSRFAEAPEALAVVNAAAEQSGLIQ